MSGLSPRGAARQSWPWVGPLRERRATSASRVLCMPKRLCAPCNFAPHSRRRAQPRAQRCVPAPCAALPRPGARPAFAACLFVAAKPQGSYRRVHRSHRGRYVAFAFSTGRMLSLAALSVPTHAGGRGSASARADSARGQERNRADILALLPLSQRKGMREYRFAARHAVSIAPACNSRPWWAASATACRHRECMHCRCVHQEQS